MVASRNRLDHGRAALRVEAGVQDAGLDLGARDRQLVEDALQLAALDDERRLPVRGLDLCAHLGERLGHAIHRPPPERLVAGQLEAARLPREDPGQQPEGRARVATVDRPAGLAQAAQPGAFDADRVHVVLVNGHAERAHRGERRLRVSRAAEALDAHLAVADRPDENGPVRDRLVAGHRDVTAQRGGRLDLHSASTGETTTP